METVTQANEETVKICDWSHDIFVNRSGQKLFRNKWTPLQQRPKAGVFFSHGMGDHSSGIDSFAERLVSEGYVVYAHDHAGHGQSDGDRLIVSDFNQFVVDVVDDATDIKKQYPADMPWFLAGHSMGGTISMLVGLDYSDTFQGIVLIAPFLTNDAMIRPWMVALMRTVSRWLPRLGVATVDPAIVSSDPVQVEYYRTNPHVHHGSVPLIGVLNLLEGAKRVTSRTSAFRVPFFIMHSPPDKLCAIKGSHQFYAEARSQSKQIKIYEGLEHDLIHERQPDRDIIIQDIIDWLNQHA